MSDTEKPDLTVVPMPKAQEGTTPKEMLQEALGDEDLAQFGKGLVLLLDDSDLPDNPKYTHYITRWRSAGLDCAGILLLMEAFKAHLLKEMGYG